VGGDDGAQVAIETPGVVGGGHGGVGEAGEGGGHLFGAGAPVGEPATVIPVVEGGGVPGVGGVPGAGLAGVTAVGVEGGGAQEVCVVPGAALGAVDGAGPGV
jgi:hypothetical protein